MGNSARRVLSRFATRRQGPRRLAVEVQRGPVTDDADAVATLVEFANGGSGDSSGANFARRSRHSTTFTFTNGICDVPNCRTSGWMPLPVLERVMGRFLIVKAFKPLLADRATVRSAA